MIRQALRCSIALLVLSAAAYGETPGEKKSVYTVKLATIIPEGSTWMDIMHDFEYLVKRTTGDRVKFVWYAGGVKGDEPEVVKKLKKGEIDGGGFTGLGLGSLVPEVRVLELPVLFKNYDELDYVLGKLDATFKKLFDKRGYVLLSWTEQGFIYLFSNTPVHNINDIASLKLWIWSGDNYAKIIFDSLGFFAPIPLPVQDVLHSLQAGKIDAFYNTPLGAVAFQWHPKAKYMLGLPIVYGMGALIISKKTFTGFPSDIQNALIDGGKKIYSKIIASVRKDNVEIMSNFPANGINIEPPDPQLENTIREKSKGAYLKLSKDYYPEWLLTGVWQAINDYRGRK